MQTLKEIADVINGVKKGSLSDLSGQFYTVCPVFFCVSPACFSPTTLSPFLQVIPHDFGFQRMSNFVISDMETVKKKMEMVQSLGDIEIATKVMGGSGKQYDEHPADVHYRNLKYTLSHFVLPPVLSLL